MQQLVIQPSQQAEQRIYETWDQSNWEHVVEQGLAISAFRDETLLGVGGLVPIWRGRAAAWAVLASSVTGPDLLFGHRIALELMDAWQREYGFVRVEAHVKDTFVNGHRWARLLGFQTEGLMRCYDPFGDDYRLYARIAK